MNFEEQDVKTLHTLKMAAKKRQLYYILSLMIYLLICPVLLTYTTQDSRTVSGFILPSSLEQKRFVVGIFIHNERLY